MYVHVCVSVVSTTDLSAGVYNTSPKTDSESSLVNMWLCVVQKLQCALTPDSAHIHVHNYNCCNKKHLEGGTCMAGGNFDIRSRQWSLNCERLKVVVFDNVGWRWLTARMTLDRCLTSPVISMLFGERLESYPLMALNLLLVIDCFGWKRLITFFRWKSSIQEWMFWYTISGTPNSINMSLRLYYTVQLFNIIKLLHCISRFVS